MNGGATVRGWFSKSKHQVKQRIGSMITIAGPIMSEAVQISPSLYLPVRPFNQSLYPIPYLIH